MEAPASAEGGVLETGSATFCRPGLNTQLKLNLCNKSDHLACLLFKKGCVGKHVLGWWSVTNVICSL